MNTKTFLSLAIALMMVVTAYAKQAKTDNMVVVAYVTSWTNEVPDPSTMTHINYAFGHVNDTFDGVRIDNPDRLRMIVGLKAQNPAESDAQHGRLGQRPVQRDGCLGKEPSGFVKDCRRRSTSWGWTASTSTGNIPHSRRRDLLLARGHGELHPAHARPARGAGKEETPHGGHRVRCEIHRFPVVHPIYGLRQRHGLRHGQPAQTPCRPLPLTHIQSHHLIAGGGRLI